MRRINPARAALSVGTVIGLFHILWSTLVAIGVAKAFMDFVLRVHFVRLDYAIAPFAMGTAALLVVITFAVGALFGLVFAHAWNCLARCESAHAGRGQAHS
ncbi:hypothetical protein [Sphingobium aquiterrae]|uniref:hypothetical protein n=1 Tax=Sphingobium aquiterrae TaxID=2038656 RepID=UPI00301AF4F9